MKTTKGIKTALLFMTMLTVSMLLVSAASAQTEVQSDATNNESASTSDIMYAEINAYGSSQADAGEETDIYVSGEIGGITVYVEKFHVTDMSTGRPIDESDYTTKASGTNWVFAGGQWSEVNNVVGHETFYQHWGVTIDEPGTYEVKASVVGFGGIPAEQDTFILTVS